MNSILISIRIMSFYEDEYKLNRIVQLKTLAERCVKTALDNTTAYLLIN